MLLTDIGIPLLFVKQIFKYDYNSLKIKKLKIKEVYN